jgi:Septum formation
VDFAYRIPGTTEPEITISRSALGNVSVRVAGQKVKRRGRGMRYEIPLADGTTTELEVTGQWRGLKAKVNGVETALEPPVSPIYVALIFLPLALVIGGLIGGVVGLFASMANMIISRRRLAGPLKLAAMVLVAALGVGAYFAIGFAIAPVPKLAMGDCVNGVHAGVELSASNFRSVDCAASHDNEVVGLVAHHGTGAYPGMQPLFDFAQVPCRAAFESYVGLSFDASVLGMTLVVPSDLTWIKGDRTIACVAGTLDGSQLTGSVRGTAR